MIFVAEKLGNPAVALNCLKQLKLIPNQFDLANNEDMRIKLFASTFSIELSMFTRRGDLQHAMELLQVTTSVQHAQSTRKGTSKQINTHVERKSTRLNSSNRSVNRMLSSP